MVKIIQRETCTIFYTSNETNSLSGILYQDCEVRPSSSVLLIGLLIPLKPLRNPF